MNSCIFQIMENFARVGEPKNLEEKLLPTYTDIIKYILFVKKQKQEIRNSIELCATRIESIWNRTNIPIVSKNRIIQLVKNHYSNYLNLKNSPYRTVPTENYMKKINRFLNKCSDLFDICTCKCRYVTQCTCTQSRKANPEDATFLNDQRTTRLLMMSERLFN